MTKGLGRKGRASALAPLAACATTTSGGTGTSSMNAMQHDDNRARSGGTQPPASLWDLTQTIGTGQSLSVGMSASDAAATAPSFNNLELSLGSAVVPPFDKPDDPTLSLVPLKEPIRPFATTYPSAYPQNIYGETPHGAMASQITQLVRQAGGSDFVTVHSVVGENGQGIALLRKGSKEVVTRSAGLRKSAPGLRRPRSCSGRLAWTNPASWCAQARSTSTPTLPTTCT